MLNSIEASIFSRLYKSKGWIFQTMIYMVTQFSLLASNFISNRTANVMRLGSLLTHRLKQIGSNVPQKRPFVRMNGPIHHAPDNTFLLIYMESNHA
ncbi:hypothetical protein D8T50_20255 [Vibrio vulnificus]|nr:hypothetical protein D8T50_20255 [Vibrio vulnificus]